MHQIKDQVELMSVKEKNALEIKLRSDFSRFKTKEIVTFLENFCLKREHQRYCSTKPEALLVSMANGQLQATKDLTRSMIEELAT